MFEARHTNKWTIVFLIYVEINETKEASPFQIQLLNLLIQIKTWPLQEGCQILLLVNGVFLSNKRSPVLSREKTHLWLLQKNNKLNRNKLATIYSDTSLSFMQSADKIGDILERIHENKFIEAAGVTKGEQYFIITWDHGSGFGIFKKDAPNHHLNPSDFSYRKSFEILANKALANAFKKGFKEKKVDVLLMYNCIMMNVHACYSLKDTVEYFVAPQTMMGAPGYNYNEIIRGVYEGLSAEYVAKLCIDSLYLYAPGYKKNIDKWAIFCFDLKMFDSVIAQIEEITLLLVEYMPVSLSIKMSMHVARNRCYLFDENLHYYLVDFIQWFNELIHQLSTNQKNINAKLLDKLNPLQVNLTTAIRNSCIAKMLGTKIQNHEISAGILTNDPYGLSIYFPRKISKDGISFRYFADEKSLYCCDFLLTGKWLFLLKNLQE